MTAAESGDRRLFTTLRLFFICLAFVLLICGMEVAHIKDWETPNILRLLCMAPAAGLGYLEVFFHELGHTVTLISYGQLAVPTFNFHDGGGFAMPIMDRSMILQAIVYAGLAYLGWLLAQAEQWLLLGALCAVAFIQVCFTFGQHYTIAVNFMGHGGSTLVGCFCLYRAVLGRAVEMRHTAERAMQLCFGLYAPMHNMILSWSIMTDEAARQVYEAGIGGHIANDYTVIADRLDTSLEHVAAFGMVYTILCLLGTAALIVLSWQSADLDVEATLPPRINKRNFR